MLVSGGLILWVLILYVVLAALCAALALAIAWCGYRAVHACLFGFQTETDRPLDPSLLLTPARARRNYEQYVRLRAAQGLRPRRR